MADYKAPLRDIRFVRNELLNFDALYARLPGYEEHNSETLDAIAEEMAHFCEKEISPLYRSGDEEGCHWDKSVVTTPKGFKEAYQKYVEGGWPTMTASAEFGGQGLPESVGVMINEMLATGNWAWAMYPGLSHGAKHTLEVHGNQEQQQIYLTKLVEGKWTGTMCLTEPHCGSDLGLLKTKAAPQADGTYKITGTKIFISAGEHDMAENIVHIVIARLVDAPQGTKGISLFIVPKFLPDGKGNIGKRNGLACGSLEHKMGIHGNATCVMNFDGATAFMIGQPNNGLKYMFTFMNAARVGTAIQGLSHAERALQGAVPYARDRLQMRSLSGVKNPQEPADPIIVHPDVRRMLLTTKAFSEGGRMLVHYLGMLLDLSKHSPDVAEKKKSEDLLAFLTPIAKAFLTETGFEAANLGMQVYGGHGYIRENGMEQNVRDSRISMLYEGTTGIQAIDLLGRKVMQTGGALLNVFVDDIKQFIAENKNDVALKNYFDDLEAAVSNWQHITTKLGEKVMVNMDEIGAASVDYLMYSGYVTLAFFWARAVKISLPKSSDPFYQAKLQTAQFYYKKLLPRTLSLAKTIENGSESLMAMPDTHFIL